MMELKEWFLAYYLVVFFGCALIDALTERPATPRYAGCLGPAAVMPFLLPVMLPFLVWAAFQDARRWWRARNRKGGSGG